MVNDVDDLYSEMKLTLLFPHQEKWIILVVVHCGRKAQSLHCNVVASTEHFPS